MLHVARECGGATRTTPSTGPNSLLSFGEFCLFSTDLQRGYHHQSSVVPQLNRQCSSTPTTPDSRKLEITRKHNSKCNEDCHVFLGGFCNPIMWREDVAVPFLKEHGIDFYNPQVTHWEEALVEREHRAKETASVLFFVFDKSTRNVASMVEVAYMAACKRKIILVLDSYPEAGHSIGGEPMSQREYEELSGGLNTVQDLVERRGIPVFSQIKHALECTVKIIKDNLWPQQLGREHQVTPVRHSHLQPAVVYDKVVRAFNGRSLTLSDAQDVFAEVTSRPMSHDELLTVVAAKKGINAGSISVSSELPLKEIMVTADEFCCIVAEFTCPGLDLMKQKNVFSNNIVSRLQKALGWESPRRSPRFQRDNSPPLKPQSLHPPPSFPASPNSYHVLSYDIYLGGVRDKSQSWQEKEAIPKLKEHGISYCVAGTSLPRSPASPTRSFNSNMSNGIADMSPEPCSKRKTANSSRRKDIEVNGIKRNREKRNHQAPDILHTLPDEGDDKLYSSESRGRLYPSEAANIDQCRVLLFVITNDTRCVSTMTLASHYIGLGCNVVLCVQNIPEDATVDGEQLTKAAIKDYNRGRSYLTDQAKKDNIPVFTKISDAVEAAIEKSKNTR